MAIFNNPIVFFFSLIGLVCASDLVQANGQSQQVISKRTAPKLNTVTLNQFQVLASMFTHCNLYIITPGIHLGNLAAISQPRLYYTDYQQYIFDYFSKPGAGTPLMPLASSGWDLSSKSYCKAEIAIDWSQGGETGAGFPRQHVQDFFTLEPRFDSNFVYQVLIAFPGTEYPTALFTWSLLEDQPKNLRQRLSYAARSFFFNHIRYIYMFQYSKLVDKNGQNFPKRLSTHDELYEIVFMDIICLVCRPNDIVKESWLGQTAEEKILHIANQATSIGTILAHEETLKELKEATYVSVYGLSMETGNLFYPKTQTAFEEFISRKLNHQGNQAERDLEGRMVLSRLMSPVLPETVLVNTLRQKYLNMSFLSLGDLHRLDFAPYYMGSAEAIHGPGTTWYSNGATDWHSARTPIGSTNLRFVTCANITIVSKTGLLYKPMDNWTWAFLCFSIGVICAALQLTMSNRQNLTSVFPLFYMIGRILLENFQDISWKLKKWPTAFAIIVATMALCSITITNGYRGVLTSDLVMAPDVSGPVTFRAVLKEGGWEFIPYFSTRLVEGSGPKMMALLRMYFILQQLHFRVNSTDLIKAPGVSSESSDMTLLDYTEASMLYDSVRRNMDLVRLSGVFPCPCNRTAFITLESSVAAFSLPDACMKKLEYSNFVRGADHIMPTTLYWVNRWERPGPVWLSLGRLLESGVYNWLNVMLRYVRSDVVATGRRVELVSSEQRVEVMHMGTPILESGFSVWLWMILTSVLTFLVEICTNYVWSRFNIHSN